MSEQPKVTALHPSHRDLNAHLIQFAGWEMPAYYGSAIQEHHAVRTKAGMFDVSHMGRLYVDGDGAEQLLDRVLTANVRTLPESRARYCMACQEDGGILDDLIVYRLGSKSYLVVANASNREVILGAMHRSVQAISDVTITDRTLETVMIALQGPNAIETLSSISGLIDDGLRPFHYTRTEVLGNSMLVARTGYTGEDGVELITEAGIGRKLWQALLDKNVTPCGLVARDSLRLEAALRLWGNDMDTTVNPYQAGLGRFVDLDKGDFLGKAVLSRVKEQGVAKRLIGFEMVGRGVPRHGFPILDGGTIIGEVTSGGHSPTLDKNIGLGYVPTAKAQKDTPLIVDVRGRQVEIKVVSLPFYRRPPSE